MWLCTVRDRINIMYACASMEQLIIALLYSVLHFTLDGPCKNVAKNKPREIRKDV